MRPLLLGSCSGFLLLLALGCGGGRTRTPTQGLITVSGTCGAESASDTSGYSYELAESSDFNHLSLEVSIDDGKLVMVRLEMNGVRPNGGVHGEGAVTTTFRGELKPNVPVTVGQWIDLKVPMARIDDETILRTDKVKMRVLGREMEVTGGTTPIKGPCSWGRAEH